MALRGISNDIWDYPVIGMSTC